MGTTRRTSPLFSCAINLEALQILQDTQLFDEADYNFIYHRCLELPYFDAHKNTIRAWELCCLSAIPQAMIYAFQNLGINSDTQNLFSELPIHLAARSKSRRQVLHAIQLGCHSNQVTSSSVLHIAAEDDDRDMTLFLLRCASADPHLRDGEGLTPCEVANNVHAEDVRAIYYYDNQFESRVSIWMALPIRRANYSISNPHIRDESYLVLRPEKLQNNKFDFELFMQHINSAVTNRDIHGVHDSYEIMVRDDAQYYSTNYDKCYAVQVLVNQDDLDYDEDHWVLKCNANIHLEHIVGAKYLTSDSRVFNRFVSNRHAGNEHALESLCAASVRERFLDYLKQTPELNSVPKREMIALASNQETFQFRQFQMIAARHVQSRSLFGGINQFTRDFCQAILTAKNFYDVADWICKNFQRAPERKICSIM